MGTSWGKPVRYNVRVRRHPQDHTLRRWGSPQEILILFVDNHHFTIPTIQNSTNHHPNHYDIYIYMTDNHPIIIPISVYIYICRDIYIYMYTYIYIYIYLYMYIVCGQPINGKNLIQINSKLGPKVRP